MLDLLLVGLGGALGGALRYRVSGFVGRRVGETFPVGTLVVNVTGSAALGLLAGLLPDVSAASEGARQLWLALAVGVLGSYTTVSSFSLQTLALLRGGERHRALLNVVLSLALGLAAAAAGLALASA